MTVTQADSAPQAARNVAVRQPPSADSRFAGFLALEDFEAAARRHLPRMLYGFISGGAETNASRARQSRQLPGLCVRARACWPTSRGAATPRCCSAAPTPRRSASRRWAPAAICAYRGDLVCAQAAAAANIPMILSGASLIRLEEVRAGEPDRLVPGLSAGRRRAHRAARRSRRAPRATRCSC